MKHNRYIFAGCGLLVFAIAVLFIWQANVDDRANASQSETRLVMMGQYDHHESAGLLSRRNESVITLMPTVTPFVTIFPSTAATDLPTITPTSNVVAPATVPTSSAKQTTTTVYSTPAPTTKKPTAAVTPTVTTTIVPKVTPTVTTTIVPKVAPTVTPTATPTVTANTTLSPTPVPQTETTAKPGVDWQNQSQAQWLSEIFRLTNEVRKENGIAALSKPSAALLDAAAVRAKECSISFSHTRPDDNGSRCFTVLDQFSITRSYAGENLLAGTSGYLTPESAIAAWMASEGHRKNILRSDFTTVGIAFYRSGSKDYMVQLFIG